MATSRSDIRVGDVRPVPTEDEVAAIVAAVEASWPRPAVAGPAEDQPSRWRFAGRWWSKPIPARRSRPW
jgi:hypothetical protein